MISIPSYQQILAALAKGKVRYLVAGGIAMNIHGLTRSTFDLDLIIFLEKKNILQFVKVMRKLGYKPKVLVEPEDFADEKLRRQWVEEKNMVVFSFYHSQDMMNVVDVFVEHPRPFEEMFKAGKISNLLGQKIRAAGLQDMLYMKKKAQRPKDELDIRFLENIIRKQKDD